MNSNTVDKEKSVSSKIILDKNGTRYVFRSKPVWLNLSQRVKFEESTGIPDNGLFHISLIGWTNKTSTEINNLGDKVLNQFGDYKRILNNCQHFLRLLFDDVHNKKVPGTNKNVPQATDFPWFKKIIKNKARMREHVLDSKPPSASTQIAQRVLQDWTNSRVDGRAGGGHVSNHGGGDIDPGGLNS
jgi:hypothetical protein